MSTPTRYPTTPEASSAPHLAESATLAARQAYLAGVPALFRSQVERAFAKTASPRKAIAAKCLDCCGFLRDEVRHCTAVLCPLHAYRPFQADGGVE